MRFPSKAGGVRRRLLVLALALIALVAALPWLAAPVVRWQLTGRLEERLDAEAALGELSLGWGTLRAADLAVTTREGRTIASARTLDAQVGLLALLRGDLDLEAELDGLELHLWKEPDGRWNVEGPGGNGGAGERAPRERDREPEPLPDVTARLALRHGRIVVHGAEGATTLEVELWTEIERWEESSPFTLDLQLFGPGPGGPSELAGAARVAGTFALAGAGRLGAMGASGELSLELDGVDAAALAPAASLFFPLEELAGAVGGHAALALAPGLALSGELALAASDLRVRPAERDGRAAPALELPSLTLRGEASAEAHGAGRQTLSLAAGSALDARYEGTLAPSGEAGGGRALDGTLRLRADLAKLALLARGFAPAAAEREPAGVVTGEATLAVRLDERSRPLSLAAEGRLDAEGLSAAGTGGASLAPEALAGLGLSFDLEAEPEPLAVRGKATLAPLALDWPVGSEMLRLREERVALALDLSGRSDGALDSSLALDAALVSGTLSALVELPGAGDGAPLRIRDGLLDLRYVPDRAGELLAPWLPGRLEGAEPEPIEGRFEARLGAGADLAALLAGLRAELTLGLGRAVLNGLALGGDLELRLVDGVATMAGELTANGGTLAIDGALPLEGGSRAGAARRLLHLKASGVRAEPELAPLLSRLHPAFAASRAVEGGALAGVIESELELTHAGLTLDALAGGGADELAAGLNGEGSFALSEASIQGSPLLVEILGELGLDAGRSLDLEPIRFVIEAGRLSYPKPWQWTIDGVRTSFTGSIGLDRTLSMVWSVPVTDELVEKHSFLSALEGQTLELPIGGTITRPRLEVEGLLSQLASKAVQGELEKALGELGGGGGDPAELLSRADALWKEGRKEEAAALYQELREEHKLSLVYALNRDRIKDRAKYRPPR